MINIKELDDETLIAYDRMMIEATIKVELFATLAISIWDEVLKELDKRNLVGLCSGSYDDIGNANINRLYLNLKDKLQT